MDREYLELTSESLRDLVFEEYLVIDGKEIPIEIVENKYDSSGRHQEYHHIIFKRLSDNKYFRANYSTSVKDSMGWEECNYEFEAEEVFPEQKIITIYK